MHFLLFKWPETTGKKTFSPESKPKKTLVVVLRGAARWGIDGKTIRENSHLIVNQGSEGRGAHLTPGSRAGGAILKRLQASGK